MICPKCHIKMGVTHSFDGGDAGRTLRTECPQCHCVGTVAQIVVVVDPCRGEGAYSLAKHMREGRAAVLVASRNKEGS